MEIMQKIFRHKTSVNIVGLVLSACFISTSSVYAQNKQTITKDPSLVEFYNEVFGKHQSKAPKKRTTKKPDNNITRLSNDCISYPPGSETEFSRLNEIEEGILPSIPGASITSLRARRSLEFSVMTICLCELATRSISVFLLARTANSPGVIFPSPSMSAEPNSAAAGCRVRRRIVSEFNDCISFCLPSSSL